MIPVQTAPAQPTTLRELAGQDILSVNQFSRPLLEELFDLAREMRERVRRDHGVDLLNHRIMAALFYEPSTRTSSSFIAAMERLGGSVIPITQGVQFSSVSKGESLADTVKTLEQYSDVIVLRHPEMGSAQAAAAAAGVPVINAGDGAGEHPTQALLDLYTIQEELGRIDGLNIAMVGDLRFGRTVHSLTQLLTLYDVSLDFVSPEILRLPMRLFHDVRTKNIPVRESDDVHDVIETADVLYVTRVQKERFGDLSQYDAVKDSYTITPELLTRAKSRMTVMHPLPRITEISASVDADPRAAYFRQVENGLYIRMALLAAVLGKA